MAGPITWRNVEGPSSRDALLGLNAAQQSFNSGFSILEKMLGDRYKAQEDALRKQDLTNALSAQELLAGARTPEEVEALRGQFLQQRDQINDPTIRSQLLGAEAKALQNTRTLVAGEQTYLDAQTERAMRGDVNKALSLAMAGKLDEANALVANSPFASQHMTNMFNASLKAASEQRAQAEHARREELAPIQLRNAKLTGEQAYFNLQDAFARRNGTVSSPATKEHLSIIERDREAARKALETSDDTLGNPAVQSRLFEAASKRVPKDDLDAVKKVLGAIAADDRFKGMREQDVLNIVLNNSKKSGGILGIGGKGALENVQDALLAFDKSDVGQASRLKGELLREDAANNSMRLDAQYAQAAGLTPSQGGVRAPYTPLYPELFPQAPVQQAETQAPTQQARTQTVPETVELAPGVTVKTPPATQAPSSPAPQEAAIEAENPSTPATPVDQRTADRAALTSLFNKTKDGLDSAGRYIADNAMLIPRAFAGAYDSTVIRGLRALGADLPYVSPSLVPDGVNPESLSPLMDQKRNAGYQRALDRARSSQTGNTQENPSSTRTESKQPARSAYTTGPSPEPGMLAPTASGDAQRLANVQPTSRADALRTGVTAPDVSAVSGSLGAFKAPTPPKQEVAKAISEGKPAPQAVTQSVALNPSTGETVPTAAPVEIPPTNWGTSKDAVKAETKNRKDWKTAVVTFVQDGDTVAVQPDGSAPIVCRIDGIDAPETKKAGVANSRAQPGGEESKNYLKDLIDKKQVDVKISYPEKKKDGTDANYGRTMCQIEIGGKDVSREMVASGLAWVYEKFAKDPELFKNQDKAKEDRKGIWGELSGGKAPIRPDIWRRAEEMR